MREFLIIILFSFKFTFISYSQIDSQSLLKLPILTNTEMNAPTTTAAEGTLIYNSDTKRVYQYDGTNWLKLVVEAGIKEITADYTILATDNGYSINVNSATDLNVTIPSGLDIGFKVTVYQTGTGKVTFIGSGGTIIKNRLSRFRTAGLDAGVGVLCTSTDVYHITGDLRL